MPSQTAAAAAAARSTTLTSASQSLLKHVTPARRRGQFETLALIFLVIIASSWILRPVKEGIFFITVGIEQLPLARMLSFAVMIPIMMVYSKLVDWFSKQRLVYVVCAIYATLFCVVGTALFFIDTSHHHQQRHNSTDGMSLALVCLQAIGWVTFFAVESCASITAAMFWSFVQLTVKGSEANDKKGYVLITAAAQIGSIGGSQLATMVQWIGLPMLTIFAGSLLFVVVVLVAIYTKFFIAPAPSSSSSSSSPSSSSTTIEPQAEQQPKSHAKPTTSGLLQSPSAQQHNDSQPPEKTGALAGLKLVFSDRYLIGIFIVCSISEIVSIVVDFQMKMLAKDQFPQAEHFTAYMARFGVWSNCASLLISIVLWATGFVEHMSLTTIVLTFPVAMTFVLSWCWLDPNLDAMFFALVAMKGLGYGLNNPAKQLLYRPLAAQTITRVKGWIDVFGGMAVLLLLPVPTTRSCCLCRHIN
jgi:ATP/ADP translocase